MSNRYTTGELAKICNVTVRTVQYYDTQNLLKPSELTEGGRRLYSEADRQKMELICTLKELGLSLEVIRRIFKEENSGQVVETFLQEQKDVLNAELEAKKQQVSRINYMIQSIQNAGGYSLQLISDIAKSMEDRKKLRRMYGKLLVYGILGEVAEIATLILWIRTGMWIPFVIAVISVMLVDLMLVQYVLGRTAFICPNCHSIFRPGYKEYLFSNHTPKTRKLTCPACRHKSYCIETTREPMTVHEQVDTEENNSNIIR